VIVVPVDHTWIKKKDIAIKLFSGKCFVCHKAFGKWFAFHHLQYYPGRKTHKDFRNSIEYNKYVLPEVVDNPDRFRLLCKICHARIDQPRLGYLGHLKKDQLIRLFMAAFETIPKERPRKGTDPSPVATSSPKCLENNKELDAYVMDEINNLKTFLDTYAER